MYIIRVSAFRPSTNRDYNIISNIYTGVVDKHRTIMAVCVSVVSHAQKDELKEFIQVDRMGNNDYSLVINVENLYSYQRDIIRGHGSWEYLIYNPWRIKQRLCKKKNKPSSP